MGFRAVSTSRASATSAVSKQAVVINTGTGNLSVGGAIIQANTSITLGVTTPGQSSANSAVTASGGPTITSLTYLDANNNPTSANAVSTTGGNIKISGTGFATNPSVYINNSLVTNTFVSSSEIRAICPAASPGNVSLFIFNTTNVGALSSSPVRYSGVPTWTTAAVSFQNNAAANVTLVASSDSTLTYTLQAGSTLPTGINLISTGYLSGTATGYSNTTSSTATIIATDQEGQATQQTLNITVTTSEPQFPYTTLLLNGDTGTNTGNAATNNTFLDSSSGNLTLTRNGNTTQGTFSPYAQTGWSNYFNGTSALQTPAASITNIIGTNGVTSASTFTIEGWIYQTQRQTYATFPCLMGDLTPTSTLCYFGFGPTSTGLLQFFWYDGANKSATGSTTIPLNTWTHIAVSISSGAIKLFVNGNLETITGTSALTNATGTTGYFAMGMEASGASGANAYFGYVSNLRVVKSALYSATFTPSTAPLTAVANTGLLTAQSNRFIDNSSNAYAFTLTGTPSVQAFSPFSPGVTYTPSLHGGGAYFNGTTSYLSQPSNSALAFGTGDFTVEYWAYFNSFSTTPVVIDGRTNIGDAALSDYYSTSGVPNLYWSTSNIATSSIAVQLNTWTHIAYTRQGTTLKIWINGVQGASVTNSTSLVSSKFNIGLIYSGSVNYHNGYVADFRINKGTALYTTAFTPPTLPLTAVSGTSLLCNFTNGGIVDAHSSGVLETVGDTKLSTAVKKFGNASIAFDGSGDYLYQINTPNYQFGTGDYTVEFWINPTNFTSLGVLVDFRTANGATGGALQIYTTTGGVITVYGGSSTGTLLITAAAAITAGTWTHVALTRSGTSTKLFINGTQSSTTATDSTSYGLGALWVGTGASGGSNYFNGYLDEIRITKGFARYTANFTAPTSAFLGQ